MIFGCDGLERAVERFAQSRSVAPYLLDRWPILRLVTWQAAVHRIDTEGEELVEIGVKRRKPERSKEKIPIESFEMANVENNPVAFGDRAVVECCGPHNFK